MLAIYRQENDLPDWLHGAVQEVQAAAAGGRLPVVVWGARGQTDALVVMTLHDFLIWSRRYGRTLPTAAKDPTPGDRIEQEK